MNKKQFKALYGRNPYAIIPEINIWVKRIVFAILWLTVVFFWITLIEGYVSESLPLWLVLICNWVVYLLWWVITEKFYPKKRRYKGGEK